MVAVDTDSDNRYSHISPGGSGGPRRGSAQPGYNVIKLVKQDPKGFQKHLFEIWFWAAKQSFPARILGKTFRVSVAQSLT